MQISEQETRDVLRGINLFIEEKSYGPTIRDILPQTRFTSSSSVKAIFDRLERRGWICRRRQDGRIIHRLLELTDEGRAQL